VIHLPVEKGCCGVAAAPRTYYGERYNEIVT
jgi:hypothetical protein